MTPPRMCHIEASHLPFSSAWCLYGSGSAVSQGLAAQRPVAAHPRSRVPAIPTTPAYVSRETPRESATLHTEGPGRAEQGYRVSGTGGAGSCSDASPQGVSRETPAQQSFEWTSHGTSRGPSVLLRTTAREQPQEIQSRVTIFADLRAARTALRLGTKAANLKVRHRRNWCQEASGTWCRSHEGSSRGTG
jgi:hypothetical protein